MDMEQLFETARKAAEASYSPYSHFKVGAALLCEDGSIFTGTNVENRSFGLTICAERSAVVAAVSAGKRRFVALAIATPDSIDPVGPCGACRQVLSEFMDKDAPVRCGGSNQERLDTTIGALVPFDSLHDLAQK
ncbi:cytidine deaminase [Gracilinema caldarium]|uniref:Cytidine deaminase n=1 Tax=Gracilinema caldarium (strain ATCC 51460 / DSM 7334 / H1) TaxID=744872 RepID=F8EXG6_GRAC1|nr:cytidine deaminase [Gracilinema caldarium]AEJ19193.1 cytidine deaminase [Gracilinema caldarium DSM 7334]